MKDTRHWQHKSIVPAIIPALKNFKGLTQEHEAFLKWIGNEPRTITVALVRKDFLGEDIWKFPPDPYAFERTRTLVETLAVHKYLVRGRQCTTKIDVRTGKPYAPITNYRLSAKGKRWVFDNASR